MGPCTWYCWIGVFSFSRPPPGLDDGGWTLAPWELLLYPTPPILASLQIQSQKQGHFFEKSVGRNNLIFMLATYLFF